jgi:hypothetical protein
MDPTRSPEAPYPLAPDSQTTCYCEWLKVRVAIRYALTFPWPSETWPEVREDLRWLLAEESRLRRQGWLN